MRLMAYTFVRTSELIELEGSEFDLGSARWDLPARRMKMHTPHIVPLSQQSTAVLRALSLLTGNGRLVFPGANDKQKIFRGKTSTRWRKLRGSAPSSTWRNRSTASSRSPQRRVNLLPIALLYVVDHINRLMLSICLCGDGVGQEFADIRVALEFDLEE
jgi:Phage integrase family